MGAVAGDFNYSEIKLINSDVVEKYIGKIIDRQENDPVRHKGKIFLAYTTASNGWDIEKGYLCSGYDGWEKVVCQPEYGGWSYMGKRPFSRRSSL